MKINFRRSVREVDGERVPFQKATTPRDKPTPAPTAQGGSARYGCVKALIGAKVRRGGARRSFLWCVRAKASTDGRSSFFGLVSCRVVSLPYCAARSLRVLWYVFSCTTGIATESPCLAGAKTDHIQASFERGQILRGAGGRNRQGRVLLTQCLFMTYYSRDSIYRVRTVGRTPPRERPARKRTPSAPPSCGGLRVPSPSKFRVSPEGMTSGYYKYGGQWVL